MKLYHQHDWDLPPKEAMALQERLSSYVSSKDDLTKVQYVAGIDVGFEDKGQITRAAIAVLEFPTLELIESVISRLPTHYPYVPGLLSFRELPAVFEALEKLKQAPDMFLCDGQGLAHPRRLGIACHLGVLTDKPAIGVGKTRLIGKHELVEDKRGAWTSLIDKGEEVGAVLRTRRGVKPIYVSIGHKVSLQSAVDWVMACTTRYKLPETTRHAHKLASDKTGRVKEKR